MQRCWLYCVVSSSKQDGTLEDQESWGRSTAAINGWEIERVFSDVSSGRDGTRALFEDLLKALRATPKSSRPHRVLMIRLDRAGRGVALDVIGAIGEIYKLGVTIHTRQDGDLDLDDIAGAMKSIFEIIGGAYENRARREKAIAMHARKKAAGEPTGIPPFGFAIENKRLVVLDPEAEFLRELFARRADGWSWRALAVYGAERGPLKHYQSGGSRRYRWALGTLYRMLANPIYRGTIVSEEIFDDVVRRRGTRFARRDAIHPWPLRGAVRCVCGYSVNGRVSGSGKWRQRYYLCMNVAVHETWRGHNATQLEEQFLDIVRRLILQPDAIVPSNLNFEDLERRLRSLERERASIGERQERVWELGETNAIAGEEVAQRLAALRERRAELDELIVEAKSDLDIERAISASSETVNQVLHGTADAWPHADVPAQQQLAAAVAEVLGGLWVDPDRQHTLYYGLSGNVHLSEDLYTFPPRPSNRRKRPRPG